MILKTRICLFLILFPVIAFSQLRNGTYNVTLNGVRHWCRIAGAEHQTTPLIIVHGGPGGNHYVFERTSGKKLEEFATVIYYEQRGSGRSEEPPGGDYSVPILVGDLEALRKYFAIEKFVPVGYSFGASLALEYALTHPQNVKGLVLESFATLQDSSVLLSQMANFYSQAAAVKRTRMDSILKSGASLADQNMAFWKIASKDDVLRFLFKDTLQGKKVLDMWAESKLGNTGKMMAALLKEKRSENLYDVAGRVRVPTLILLGVYDRNGAFPASLRLKDEIRSSQLVLFENSAHFPDVEQSEKFAEAIRNWRLKDP